MEHLLQVGGDKLIAYHIKSKGESTDQHEYQRSLNI